MGHMSAGEQIPGNPARQSADSGDDRPAESSDPSRASARVRLDANGDLWGCQGQYVGNIRAKSGVAGALQHIAQPPRMEG